MKKPDLKTLSVFRVFLEKILRQTPRFILNSLLMSFKMLTARGGSFTVSFPLWRSIVEVQAAIACVRVLIPWSCTKSQR